MSETWGRTSAAGTWPHPKPVWTLAALLVALTSSGAIAVYRYHAVWTPLQRIYASDVPAVSADGRARIHAPADAIVFWRSRASPGPDWRSRTRCGPGRQGAGTPRSAHRGGLRIGGRRLVWRDASYSHAALHAFLGRWIYRDQHDRGRC